MRELPEDDPDWAERYEALRAHALGEGPLSFVPLGLAVLRHRGVLAWMVAETSSLRPIRPAGGQGRENRMSEINLLGPRSELVGLLAGTALVVATGGYR